MIFMQRACLCGLILATLLLAGCTPATGESGSGMVAPEVSAIECEAYYRDQPGQSLDGQTMTLERDGPAATLDFGQMIFSARYSGDQFEGWTLVIDVNGSGQQQILHQLYQIDGQKGLRDQFIGGHGFTGLVYVYLPGSTAEMQFFCRVGATGE